MLRPHRLIRKFHRFRKDRQPVAEQSKSYQSIVQIMIAKPWLRALESDEIMHAAPLEAFEASSTERISAVVLTLRRQLVVRAAELLRPLVEANGHGSTGAALVEQAAALAESLVDDRVASAVEEVLARMAANDHRNRPSWPAKYAHVASPLADAPKQ